MKTAVLIVAHNTREDVVACVEALLSSGAGHESIYVADNGSTDHTADLIAQRFPGIRIIANPDNRYYAEATNQLLALADADYYLLLNPDTRPDFGALQTLLDRFAADSKLAAVAPQLRYPDGRIQISCRRFPDWRTPWREVLHAGRAGKSSWKMGDFDHRSARPVDQPMFSCIWIAGGALSEVGDLDEDYPLFFNDVEWCWRARQSGFDICFDPRVAVWHALGGTTRSYPWRKLVFSHSGFARFLWRRRQGSWSGIAGVVGVWMAFPCRAIAALFQHH